MKRLFLAVEPPPLVHEALVAQQAELKGLITRQGVRFVREDKLHLTLVFIGSADEADVIARVSDTLGKTPTPPISVTLSSVGAFPTAQRPKVIWQGLDAGLELASLVLRLQESLDISPDASFAPHITLARVNPGSKEVGWIIRPIVSRPPSEPPTTWLVDVITLYESTPSGDYVSLHTWSLA